MPIVHTHTIIPLADNPGWRCATCQSAVFARSIKQPDYCQRCVTLASNGSVLTPHEG